MGTSGRINTILNMPKRLKLKVGRVYVDNNSASVRIVGSTAESVGENLYRITYLGDNGIRYTKDGRVRHSDTDVNLLYEDTEPLRSDKFYPPQMSSKLRNALDGTDEYIEMYDQIIRYAEKYYKAKTKYNSAS